MCLPKQDVVSFRFRTSVLFHPVRQNAVCPLGYPEDHRILHTLGHYGILIRYLCLRKQNPVILMQRRERLPLSAAGNMHTVSQPFRIILMGYPPRIHKEHSLLFFINYHFPTPVVNPSAFL